MKDPVVNLRTAKLLKTVKFDIPVTNAYVDLSELNPKERIELTEYIYSQNHNSKSHRYSAPTLYLTQKWLRETRKIHIEVVVGADYGDMRDHQYGCYYYFLDKRNVTVKDEGELEERDWFDTYEEALEDGIETVILREIL